MADQWPRDFIIMCARGFDYLGNPKPGTPIGRVLGIWEEDLWESDYADGANTSGDTMENWIQRITVDSQEAFDALEWSIKSRAEKISLAGLDITSKAQLRRRERVLNRGQDNRVRTIKGKQTRKVHPDKPGSP